MKKCIIIFLLLMNIASALSMPVHAQNTNDPAPFLDFLNRFFQRSEVPTNCPANLRDQNGKCIDLTDLAQRCLYEDKLNKNNQYDPTCCRIDDQCPNGQRCNNSNDDWCKSGSSCNPHTQPTNPAPRSTQPPGADNFPYYCQLDSRWINDCNMRNLGCGPSTLAMILSYFGDTKTPQQVNSKIINTGARPSCGSVTYLQEALNNALFNDYIISPNLVKLSENYNGYSTGELNVERARQYLQNGYLIATLAYNFPCGAGCSTPGTLLDHIFVIQGIDDMVYVRDPSNCSFLEGKESENYRRRPYSVINREAYAIKKK